MAKLSNKQGNQFLEEFESFVRRPAKNQDWGKTYDQQQNTQCGDSGFRESVIQIQSSPGWNWCKRKHRTSGSVNDFPWHRLQKPNWNLSLSSRCSLHIFHTRGTIQTINASATSGWYLIGYRKQKGGGYPPNALIATLIQHSFCDT